MKTRPDRICLKLLQSLVPGILLTLLCGCACIGPDNSDKRAWARCDELQLRDEQRRTIWWGWPFGSSPAIENQQAEEWLNSH